ncbi:hypothetical protein L227DRAFT_151530 [Lentinus tigrinus ALCF2SS1-6]|uniref:Uncharacterized protein n=1 Tax=Lentinus tigrinus ALCF2SS1-6 TaxID=1328759 RepID=A0A5C2S6R8_9APHY|nr:hypothetical protein L227DRAFT_151530 [Lentinus tigrinus ALCF2SS1-6]
MTLQRSPCDPLGACRAQPQAWRKYTVPRRLARCTTSQEPSRPRLCTILQRLHHRPDELDPEHGGAAPLPLSGHVPLSQCHPARPPPPARVREFLGASSVQQPGVSRRRPEQPAPRARRHHPPPCRRCSARTRLRPPLAPSVPEVRPTRRTHTHQPVPQLFHPRRCRGADSMSAPPRAVEGARTRARISRAERGLARRAGVQGGGRRVARKRQSRRRVLGLGACTSSSSGARRWFADAMRR